MADIGALGGISGSGKTTVLANWAWERFLKRDTIYSNFDLNFDGSRKSFKTRYEEDELNFVPLFDPKDLFKIRQKGNFSIYLDEIDVWGADETFSGGVDSYNYKSEAAQHVSVFFKKRLRKMSGIVRYTVQQMRMIPPRVREETEYLYLPKIWKKYETGDPLHPVAPLVILIEEKRISVESGEFNSTGKMLKLSHPLFKFPIITKDMLKIFDTDSDILSVRDLPESNRVNPLVQNAIHDETLYKHAQNMYGINANVELIKDSGRYSKWLGDVLIVANGTTVVIDVVGVKQRYTNADRKGQAMRIDLSSKWNKIPQMLDIDRKTGSYHYFAYFDENQDPQKKEKKIWKIIPVDLLQNVCTIKDHNLLSKSKIVTAAKVLKVQNCGPLSFDSLETLLNIKKN